MWFGAKLGGIAEQIKLFAAMRKRRSSDGPELRDDSVPGVGEISSVQGQGKYHWYQVVLSVVRLTWLLRG